MADRISGCIHSDYYDVIFETAKKKFLELNVQLRNSLFPIFAPPCQSRSFDELRTIGMAGKTKTFYSMHQKRKYRGTAWLVFFISSAALAFAIISHWPWLTLIIPFVTTSFVW